MIFKFVALPGVIFSGILSREHCTMDARVVITIALRVRALRTGCGNWSGAASARRLLMPARETEAIILKTFPLGEADRSEEHTSELQSHLNLVCRLLLEKKKNK